MERNTYLFDVTKVNDPIEAVKTAMMNIVEGCVFIKPEGFVNILGKINSRHVILCSDLKNPDYKKFQRIHVTVRNLAEPRPEHENNPDHPAHRERNIRVYVYDTRMKTRGVDPVFAFINGPDLMDGVKHADIVVYHKDGQEDTIRIEAQNVELEDWIDIQDVIKPMSERAYDSRSMTGEKYVTHKDTLLS